ncbi:MAG: hypothetical protein ACYS5V_11385, partial [Planctomycetota bacterium]
RALSADGGRKLTEGVADLHLYPPKLLAGSSKLMSGKRLFVWDRPEGLPAVLADAGIAHTRIDNEKALSLARPAMIIVGPDRIPDQPFAQTALVGQAREGAGVLILAQSRLPRLAGMPLRRRLPPQRLTWRPEHPLARTLRTLRPSEMTAMVWALALPVGAPGLAVGFWPREPPGRAPVPVSALVVVRSVGKGRLVFCQMPLGDWRSDPRSQLFLADALDYMSGPVQPTPATRPADIAKDKKEQTGQVGAPKAGEAPRRR